MIIGIPISGTEHRYVINQAYVNYVKGAGMEPLLMVPDNDPDVMAKICGGLVLPGGVDVDPTFYDENNIASFNVDPERDVFERKMLYAFLIAKKPIFGICRGFQIIIREYLKTNPIEEVWLTYYQHINDHSLVEDLHIPRTSFSHKVYYQPGLYGEKGNKKGLTMFVNSMHHQSLIMIGEKEPDGSNIKILAKTRTGMPRKESGHVVEAFQIKNNEIKVLAVQWHPEELKDYKLIQTFFGVETQEKDDLDMGTTKIFKTTIVEEKL